MNDTRLKEILRRARAVAAGLTGRRPVRAPRGPQGCKLPVPGRFRLGEFGGVLLVERRSAGPRN